MRSRSARSTIAVAGLVLVAWFLYFLIGDQRPRSWKATLAISTTLQTADDQGYARALVPRTFRFPADHGSHPEFRTEWWYFTGNLAAASGRPFGFQLTFFRSGLAPRMAPRQSAWATRQAWLAHFTLTDVQGETFRSFERWSRGALGLAGAQSEPWRVWVKDWSADAVGGQEPPLRLIAAAAGVGIDLALQQGKPPVLHGERGLSRKSAEAGNASYYYSLTRMPASGSVRLGSERFSVRGLAWMDREWSTSALAADQVGWDWLSLQLSDGWDLMLYRLRRKDGTADPASSGTLIDPHGRSQTLRLGDFGIDGTGGWRSPRSGARYPDRWRVRVPAEELDLAVRPLLADQELDVSFRYWEGAVRLEGTHRGRPVAGRGYVELTGYAQP